MGTSSNLLAGSAITPMNGTTTTRETTFASTATQTAQPTISIISPSSFETASSSSILSSSSSSSLQGQSNLPQVTAVVLATSATPTTFPVSTRSSTLEPTILSAPSSTPRFTLSSTHPPATLTASIISVGSTTPVTASSTGKRTGEVSTSISPAPEGTTPTSLSTTLIPVVQSELSVISTLVSVSGAFDGGVSSVVSVSRTTASAIASTSSAHVGKTSAATSVFSGPKLTAAPVIGAVVGSTAFLLMVGILLWFLRRRRKRNPSPSPFITGTKNGFDKIWGDSARSTEHSAEWKAALRYQTIKLRNGAMTIAGKRRCDAPGVNLNRGNSQFLETSVLQHNRNNSATLFNPTGHRTAQDRFNEWWGRFTEGKHIKWGFRRRHEQSIDMFASERSMIERETKPERPQVVGMDHWKRRSRRERGSASLNQFLPQIGSLGLDFSAQQDLLVKPSKAMLPSTQHEAWEVSNRHHGADPFADPDPPDDPTRPVPGRNKYRSDDLRGLSMATSAGAIPSPDPPSPTSRYPSSIMPPTSLGSYRDTVFSFPTPSDITTARNGKGRSDPFDLERPELWRPRARDFDP